MRYPLHIGNIGAVLLISSLLFHTSAQAVEGVPRSMGYQGRLYSSSGVLLGGAGTPYCFKFSLWDGATVGAGTKLWPAGAPGAAQLTVRYGVFSANIGIDTPDPLTYNFYDSDSAHLQVEVAAFSGSCGSYETLSPRQPLSSAGYAINADTVDGAHAGTASNTVLKLTSSGGISLSETNPEVSATGTNKLRLQGGASGDLELFSAANTVTSSGNLSLAGSVSSTSALLSSATGLTLGTSSSATGGIVFKNSSNLNTVTLNSGATSSTYGLTLPTGQGAADSYLRNDGSGSLSWVTSPGCTACVFNDGTASDVTNTVAPTNDVTSLTLKQTTAGSPTKNIFAVTNSAATATYLAVSNTGGVNMTPATGEAALTNLASGSYARYAATAVPSASLLQVTNAGYPVTSANVYGFTVNTTGGAAAVESGAVRLDIQPGATTGGTWNGIRLVAGGGASSGVALNGIKLDGPSSPGSGTEIGLNIGTGWDYGISIATGGLRLTAQNDPTTPISGTLNQYASNLAGRTLLKMIDSTGNISPIQPSLFENQVAIINAGSGTALNSFGTGVTSVGTLSHPAVTESTGYMVNFVSAGTSGSTAGTGTNAAMFFRGTGTGANGFFYQARVYFPDAQAKYAHTTTGSRIFAGLTDQTMANTVGSDNPTGNRAGFSLVPARDTAAFNWKFVTKDGTTESVSDTGVAFTAQKVYDLYIYTPKAGTTIHWRINNITDGVVTEGTVTNNLPTGSTAMRAGVQISTLEAVAHNVRLQRIYVEADR
jgi:hypothetical protein